jgi:DNA-binding beta-propeller fold protein YncE
MTAAQVAGTGTVNYAVSTDGRTTWSVNKGTDGVRPIVRNNSGTWQYNNDGGSVTGYDISVASYTNKSLGVQSDPYGICFKPDGTIVYTTADGGNRVVQNNLTTAWDLSTATSPSHGGILSTASQETAPSGVQISSDGTKMYVIGTATDTIYQYTLTNPWDVFPSSYANKSLGVGFTESAPQDIFFKPDGTKLFMIGATSDKVYEFSLSTAWDLATASYSSNFFSVASYETGPQGLSFSSDGTKMFTVGSAYVTEWALSTAWDITTTSYVRAYNSSAQETDPQAIAFKSDGTKMYIVGGQMSEVFEYNVSSSSYGTSTTWANGTVNDELYTLQQALGAQAFNRMDKTQLDAIPDANHFPTGTSLDLMIALRMDAAASTLPTSDGVTLNYDAAALNEGAVLGTDYDFFHPAANKVQIKSLAAQNLKVRVV